MKKLTYLLVWQLQGDRLPDEDMICGSATLHDQDFCKYHDPEFKFLFISEWVISYQKYNAKLFTYVWVAIATFLG